MSREIECAKLRKKAPGLSAPPVPGELGQRIYEQISQPAWQQWVEHQTILINEYRLNMLDAESRKFLREQMETFLFTEDELAKPGAFTPPENQD